MSNPKRGPKPKKKTRSGATTRAGAKSAGRALHDPKQSDSKRLAALAQLSTRVLDDDAAFESVLQALTDPSASPALRQTALASLQAASFSVVKFAPYRARYLAALRSLSKDADPELRQRVLGMLSREGDGATQKLLLAGLTDPSKALLPPEKALQLLSYDVHAAAYAAARKIAHDPPSPEAKREALRLLAADAASAPLFEQVLRDKAETPEIRRLSASALHTLAPEKLQSHARAMLLDESEDEDLKATSLTALTQFGNATAVAQDGALQKRVTTLAGRGSSGELQQGARRFLDKYGV
jgi:hypothetical protein